MRRFGAVGTRLRRAHALEFEALERCQLRIGVARMGTIPHLSSHDGGGDAGHGIVKT